MTVILFHVFAYLSGCINGAYCISRFIYKQDIRSLGSGNAGARNAGRNFGSIAFVGTVVVDTLKTIIPLAIALYLFELPDWAFIGIGVSIMVGHIWPVHLKGQGGKGVVVYLALLLILAPYILLFIGAIVGLGKLVGISSKYSGLIALSIVPFAFLIFTYFKLSVLFFILLGLVLFAHRKGS